MATSNGSTVYKRFPNYEKEMKYCAEFLNNFEDHSMAPDLIHGRKKYLVQLVSLLHPSKKQ